MAGIGFRLQNLLKDDSFISRIKAYSYAAVISSGPWIYSLLSFLAVSFFVTSEAGMNRLFQVSVIYVFAFSQVISGAFQLTATRVIADYIYESKFEMIPGVYLNTITVLAPILAAAGAVFFSGAKMGTAYAVICSLLFVLTGLIWIQLIVLTACRDFRTISYQFAIGFIISAAVSITLGARFGLMFYLGGFTGGILYIFASMHSQILGEFRPKKGRPPASPGFDKFRRYLPLVGVGFFFNAGVWIDKFVFWFAGGSRVSGLLYENSIYDRMNLILIAMLIPVMTVFTLTVETNFYVRFRNFYKSITEKENLGSIELNLSLMRQSIVRGAGTIMKVALPLAFMMVVFSRQLLAALKMPPEFQLNWCIFTLAALLHAFFMLSMILLMYFDFLDYTLRASAMFFFVNLTVNLAGALVIGPKAMGYGYLIAVTAALALSLRYVGDALDNLLFHTFSRERVPGEIVIRRERE